MSTWERCLANWVSTLTKCLPRLPYRVFALDGCVHYRGVCLTIHECMPIRRVSALERCLHYRDVCLIGMASLQCWLLKKIIELCAIQSCLPRVSAFLTAFCLTHGSPVKAICQMEMHTYIQFPLSRWSTNQIQITHFIINFQDNFLPFIWVTAVIYEIKFKLWSRAAGWVI